MAKKPETKIRDEELNARLLLELERRKKLDPMAYYEPASEKILAFHKSPALTRALFGANRSSKTESALQEVLWHIRGNHPYIDVPKPPVYWRIVVPDFNQVEKVINDKLRRMTPPSLLIDGSWEKSYNTRTHIITFANGSKIDIMTHLQPIAAFEGSSRHGTLFDEEAPKDIYTSCVMRHVDVQGKTIMAMTPLNGLTYTYDEIYLKSFSSPNVKTWTLSIYENRFLTQDAIDEIAELVTDEVDREIRLYGKFRSKTGMVFKAFDPEVHVYDPEKYYDEWDGDFPPRYWMHFVGIDPGWDHPTGIAWVGVDPDEEEFFVYREHKASNMYPEEHAEIIRAYNSEMGITNPIYVIDSQAAATTPNGSRMIDDYRKEGIYPVLGTKKLFDGNLLIAKTMKVVDTPYGKYTRFHISKECPDAISEIGKYQRAKPTDMNSQERFIDKYNDLISAIRYAIWEAKKWDYSVYVDTTSGYQHKEEQSSEKKLKTGY